MTIPVESLIKSDDLLTSRIDVVLFEATTGCNLRCTYCAVSAPSYRASNFDFTGIDDIVQSMASANVRTVQLSGHGETTVLPGWDRYCQLFFDRGIALCITSNFSKIFVDSEIDVLARMDWITVSIDTIDRELLMAIRRKVDLRTIIYNLQSIRLRALRKYHRLPIFNWQCTLSDQVVWGLPDWVQMGLLNGVTKFTLGNLVEQSEVAQTISTEGLSVPRHIARLDRNDLIKACALIREASLIARDGGGKLNLQPGIAEGVFVRLASFGINAPSDLLGEVQ